MCGELFPVFHPGQFFEAEFLADFVNHLSTKFFQECLENVKVQENVVSFFYECLDEFLTLPSKYFWRSP